MQTNSVLLSAATHSTRPMASAAPAVREMPVAEPGEKLSLGGTSAPAPAAAGHEPGARPRQLHVAMQISQATLPTLAGLTLALVKESEVKQGQWVGHTAVAFPEIKHADIDPLGRGKVLTQLPMSDWARDLARDPSLTSHLAQHPDQFNYLTNQGAITTGQTLSEALAVARKDSTTPAQLDLAIQVPDGLALDDLLLAFIPTAELDGHEWRREPGTIAVAPDTSAREPGGSGLYAPVTRSGNPVEERANFQEIMPKVMRHSDAEQQAEWVFKNSDAAALLTSRGFDVASATQALLDFPPDQQQKLTPEQVADPSVRQRAGASGLIMAVLSEHHAENELGKPKADQVRELLAKEDYHPLCGPDGAIKPELEGITLAVQTRRHAEALLTGGCGPDLNVASVEWMARHLELPPEGSVASRLGLEKGGLFWLGEPSRATLGAAAERLDSIASRMTVQKWRNIGLNVAAAALDVALWANGHPGAALLSGLVLNGVLTRLSVWNQQESSRHRELAGGLRQLEGVTGQGDLAVARHLQSAS